MILVDYVSEWLLVALSVEVAGGDEVVDSAEGMFTRPKVLYCLGLSTKCIVLAGAAVTFALWKQCASSASDSCELKTD